MKNELNRLSEKLGAIEYILNEPLIQIKAMPYRDVLKLVYPLEEAKEIVNDLILEEELYG